jgi:hypothetical protein
MASHKRRGIEKPRWACEWCGNQFATKARAEACEAKHRFDRFVDKGMGMPKAKPRSFKSLRFL